MHGAEVIPKGYFVPIHVAIHPQLRPIDGLLFGLVESLDGPNGCFADYGYLAARLCVPLSTLVRSLERLIETGFIKKEKKAHSRNKRIIRVRESYRTRYEGMVRRWSKEIAGRNGNRRWSKEIGGYTARKPLEIGGEEMSKCDLSTNEREMSKCNLTDVKMTTIRQENDVKMTTVYNTKNILKQRSKTMSMRYPNGTASTTTGGRGFVSEIAAEAEERKAKRKELSYQDATPQAREVVDAWNDMHCGVMHKVESEGVEKALWVIENRILSRYSIEQVIDTMRLFRKYMRNPKTYGLPDRKRSIEEFFVTSHFLRQRAMRRGWDVPRPLFYLLVEEESMKKAHRANPETVSIAEKIKTYWLESVLAEDAEVTFTGKQEADFIEAAERVREYKSRKRLDRYFDNPTDDDYIDMLFKALANRFGATGFGIGQLKSHYTWTDVLPKYLTSKFKG